MEKRKHVHLVSILVLSLFLAAGTQAQNEQWLQYRSANEARQIVPDTGYQFLQPIPGQPPGIKLPPLESQRPLFLEWKTPMVPAGRIWMAFGQSNPKGGYDRLYFDANADGDLTNDPVCQPYRRDSQTVCFGPVKAVFAAPDGPITYHLNMELRTYSGRTDCLLSPACWYEGQVTVGGVKKRCVLVDHNVNGAFNDKSPDYSKSDRIRFGEQTTTEGGAVGDYVEVDGKLYKVEIARDGACLSLAPAPDVPYGTVRLADNLASICVSGANGSFVRKPENGRIKLPVGEYRVQTWTAERKDDAGAKWEMRAMVLPDGAGSLVVAQDKEANLPFGEPIYSRLQANKNDAAYVFEQRLEGRQGERVTLTRNGAQPPAPKLRIRSQDGSYDRSLNSEYG